MTPAGSTDKVIPLPGPGGTAVMLLLCGSLLASVARADSVITVGPVAPPRVITTASQAAPAAAPAPSSPSKSRLTFTHGVAAPVLTVGFARVTGTDGRQTIQTTTGVFKSGAGYMFGWSAFPMMNGVHALTFGIPVFLNIGQQPGVSGITFTMTTGAMVGVMDGLLSIGPAYDLFNNVGAPGATGLLIGKPDITCFHWLVSVTIPYNGLSAIMGAMSGQ